MAYVKSLGAKLSDCASGSNKSSSWSLVGFPMGWKCAAKMLGLRRLVLSAARRGFRVDQRFRLDGAPFRKRKLKSVCCDAFFLRIYIKMGQTQPDKPPAARKCTYLFVLCWSLPLLTKHNPIVCAMQSSTTPARTSFTNTQQPDIQKPMSCVLYAHM